MCAYEMYVRVCVNAMCILNMSRILVSGGGSDTMTTDGLHDYIHEQ